VLGKNVTMTDSSTPPAPSPPAPSPSPPALSAAETRVAEALLARAWGERTEVREAAVIWNRRHVVRLDLGADRSAVLKRRTEEGDGFGVELAVLEYLNGMPVPVAPRLLGADNAAGMLLMEDLGAGASLAGSLLGTDRDRARADLIAYAEALGSLHAWSMSRAGELADLRARYAPAAAPGPAWMGAAARGRDAFLGAAATLGLTVGGVEPEIAELDAMLTGSGYLGLVHGDPCPDNTRMLDGRCRVFDFETSGWGPVVLDAAYLQAPFPSCWCFASLPAEVAAPAVEAYRAVIAAAGIDLGPDWDAATAAALGYWIVARGRVITGVLEEDHQWGTTTMRPRLLTWMRNFIEAAERSRVLPSLRALIGGLYERLTLRWPDTVMPDYPALARPGSTPVPVPDWWPPET
jgi:Ser/Thr protein kinase RdoA (MazF antagonist)